MGGGVVTMAEQEHDVRYPEEQPGEDWRPLAEPWEDYLVSNHGRVWRVSKGMLIASFRGARSRQENRVVFKVPTVEAMNGGRYRQTGRTLAREVLSAFGGPCPADKPHYTARCIDGDETNCHISNLEWAPPRVKGSRT